MKVNPLGISIGYGTTLAVKQIEVIYMCNKYNVSNALGFSYCRLSEPRIPPFGGAKFGIRKAVKELRAFVYMLKRWLSPDYRVHMPREITYEDLSDLTKKCVIQTLQEYYGTAIIKYIEDVFKVFYTKIKSNVEGRLFFEPFLYAYLGYQFKNIERWERVPDWRKSKYPYLSAIRLWNNGYLAGTIRKRWYLYYIDTLKPVWSGYL